MTTVNACKITTDQRNQFVTGWEAAGGYMGDDSMGEQESLAFFLNRQPKDIAGSHWCMPWTYDAGDIEVIDGNFFAAGDAYWRKMEDEVALNVESAALMAELKRLGRI